MGWQDDPIVEDDAQAGSGHAWDNDPEVEAQQTQPPVPSLGAVALNAVPKGVANLVNTPNLINHLILKGVASIPGMDSMPEVKKFLEEGAEKFARNGPMHLMEKAGIVDPEKNPQTGLQRVVDTGIQAAVGSALVPGAGLAGAAKSAAMGAASGAAAQVTKEGTGSDLLAAIVGAAVPMAGTAAKLVQRGFRAVKPEHLSPIHSPTRAQTLEEGRKLGLKVQPSSVSSGVGTKVLESVAGPGKLDIELTIENQAAATNAAKASIGVPSSVELSPKLLKETRDFANQSYQRVAALSPKAAQALDDLKQSRFEAADHFKYYWKSGNPEAGKQARSWEQLAKSFEQTIEQEAKRLGQPQLVDQLRASRKLIARTHDIENALNVGDGHVDMRVFGKMVEEGRPLEDELLTIGKFANAFEKVSRRGSSVGTTTSGTDAASASILSASSGSLLSGGLPLLRGPARKRLLADEIQNYLGKSKPLPDVAKPAARAAITTSVLHDNAKKEKK